MQPPPPAASLTARQLLLGIRASLAVLQQIHPEIDARVSVKASDFAAVNGVSIQTGHGSFRMLDLAPLPFAVLRARFGIREADYADERVKERGSVGKSGSMFVFSADQTCILKTLRKEEADTLIKFLPAYLEHVRAEPDTLLNRFLGLYRFKPSKQPVLYFLAMSNCLQAPFELDEIYDIKGSTQGRQEADGAERHKGKIYKDLDFTSGLLLGPRKKDLLMNQLKKDINLLQAANLMDYSLIIGIKRTAPDAAKLGAQPSARAIVYRSAFTRDFGGFRSSDAADRPLQEVYFIGVIDVLQDYNVKKQLAHGWKSMQVEEEKLSTVEPSLYASRFLAFVAAKVVARPSDAKEKGAAEDAPAVVKQASEPEKEKEKEKEKAPEKEKAEAKPVGEPVVAEKKKRRKEKRKRKKQSAANENAKQAEQS